MFVHVVDKFVWFGFLIFCVPSRGVDGSDSGGEGHVVRKTCMVGVVGMATKKEGMCGKILGNLVLAPVSSEVIIGACDCVVSSYSGWRNLWIAPQTPP